MLCCVAFSRGVTSHHTPHNLLVGRLVGWEEEKKGTYQCKDLHKSPKGEEYREQHRVATLGSYHGLGGNDLLIELMLV